MTQQPPYPPPYGSTPQNHGSAPHNSAYGSMPHTHPHGSAWSPNPYGSAVQPGPVLPQDYYAGGPVRSVAMTGAGSESYWNASSEERTFAIVTQVLSLLGYFIVPLVIFLVKKDSSPFVRHHAAKVLNLHISLFIYGTVAWLLMFVLIGLVLFPAVMVWGLVLMILGIVRASSGQGCSMPLVLPIFR